MHLPATFLSVIRRKVTTCAVTICISHPFGRCSCVTWPCSPHPYCVSHLANSEARELKQADGRAGQPSVRVISAGLEATEESTKKTGHSESASSRRHRVAPLLQLREEPHHREGGKERQRSRPLQLTSGSSPRFVCFQSFFVSCVIDWATRLAILRCTTLETQRIAEIPISQTDLCCGWASGGNH